MLIRAKLGERGNRCNKFPRMPVPDVGFYYAGVRHTTHHAVEVVDPGFFVTLKKAKQASGMGIGHHFDADPNLGLLIRAKWF